MKSRKFIKTILALSLTLSLGLSSLVMTGCNKDDNDKDGNNNDAQTRATESEGASDKMIGNVDGEVTLETGDVYAVIKIKDYGEIKLELFPECAPKAVENFTKLANEGYYKGKIFHRIISNFMIQGGSPFGDGFSDPDYPTFEVEAHPKALHKYGALSMANAAGKNAQQFFIVNNTNGVPHLDGGYSVFGHTVEGFDVLDKISKVETDTSDRPVGDEIVIEEVTIHTVD